MTTLITRAPRLVRRFLATGETRCPLLCVWTLETSGNTADDPESRLPARWNGFLGRAVHFALMSLAYDSFAPAL